MYCFNFSFAFFILLGAIGRFSEAADDCGPLGFDAKHLLSMGYWYFDLPHNDCPPIPPGSFVNETLKNTSSCRIFFNLCKPMKYQCAGSVCANFVDTKDYIMDLGESSVHPFTEDPSGKKFTASYKGEELACNTGKVKVTTVFEFSCSKNATWMLNTAEAHGGAKSPQPYDVNFDLNQCQYTIKFNYSGACVDIPSGESPSKDISTGSLILILFFPGVILYFVLGILINKGRGKQGMELIPHRSFWSDLPDLIMDGFAFSMAIIMCRKEDRYLKDYENVEDPTS